MVCFFMARGAIPALEERVKPGSGGTITNNYLALVLRTLLKVWLSPASLNLNSAFDYGGYIANALGLYISDGACFCDDTTGIRLGNIALASLVNSTFSTSASSGKAIRY